MSAPRAARFREYCRTHLDWHRTWLRAYRRRDPARMRLWRWREELWRHRLTEEMLWRLLVAQDGKCGACRRAGLRLSIDHDHVTRFVMGALCFRCNRNLDELANPASPLYLPSAADYYCDFPALRVLGPVVSNYRGGWERTRKTRDEIEPQRAA